jgi:outer membrane protein assembly factor BamB
VLGWKFVLETASSTIRRPEAKIRGQACYLLLAAALVGAGSRLVAEDWPEWRGAGRQGVWNEDGVLEKFPPEGLTYSWRTPLASGYAGPAVAGGRVFVTDFRRAEGNRGTERVLCLSEQTGETLWTHEWPVSYAGIEPTWATGPRATPTVDGERVYVLGAMGALLGLDAETGRLLWKRDFVEDYGTTVPGWGIVGAPIVEGPLLISLVGGEPDAKVVAFDKQTGEEVWRALSSASEPGYNPPIVIDSGGVRQLIVWHPGAVTSLNPLTGKVYWEQPFDVQMGLTVATPVVDRGRLLVSSFFNGSMLLRLDPERPGAKLAWKGKSSSESETDGLHALITTPVFVGDHIYGICSYGQLRALDAGSGARVWESLELTGEKARWAAGLIVRNGDRFFINNDRGELVIARFTPRGYREISRTRLIEPTTRGGGRRELGLVNWSHPAYANRHIVARNDREIVRASLSKQRN